MRRAASTARSLSASRLKNQIPGFPPAVTYVRVLTSRKDEISGSGGSPRALSPVTRNGVTPIQASSSKRSSSSPSGRCDRSASAEARQWANSSSSQVWPMTHEVSGSGQVR
jgi:hypothetical protein